MEHICNPWCRGEVHAILFIQAGESYDLAKSNPIAEALLSAVGMVPAGQYQIVQIGLKANDETGFQRFYALGRAR